MQLKELRKKSNQSQREFAKLLNVSASAVSSWEVGRTQIPDDIKQIIAKHFGISANEIETPSQADNNQRKQLQRDFLNLFANESLPDKGQALSKSMFGFINGLKYFNDQTEFNVFYERFQIERAANYTSALIDALSAFVYDCGSIMALRSSEDVEATETDLMTLRDALNRLIRYCLKATADSVSINDETDDIILKSQQDVYTNKVKSIADKYSTAFCLNPAEEQQE